MDGWIKLYRELVKKPIWKLSTPEQKNKNGGNEKPLIWRLPLNTFQGQLRLSWTLNAFLCRLAI